MSEIALDEVSVLSSIYCEKDEFLLLEKSDEKGLVFRIQIEVGEYSDRKTLRVVFQLSPEYPRCLPDFSVNSEQLTRKQCQNIKRVLLEKASTLAPEPMIHELLLWLQQNFTAFVSVEELAVLSNPTGNEKRSVGEESWTSLLMIDHMRAKTKYRKIIEKWTSELGLTGRLFMGRLILILLQGTRSNIKEYLRLQRTVNVDLDSSGKKCKEKMMTVLCERPLLGQHKQLATFEVKPFLSLEELKNDFDSVGLLELYQEFVATLL